MATCESEVRARLPFWCFGFFRLPRDFHTQLNTNNVPYARPCHMADSAAVGNTTVGDAAESVFE